jgi:hypothetical protein
MKIKTINLSREHNEEHHQFLLNIQVLLSGYPSVVSIISLLMNEFSDLLNKEDYKGKKNVSFNIVETA